MILKPIEKAGDDKGFVDTMQTITVFAADPTAVGKTICAAYAAALQSPGLPIYALNKEEYLKLVEEVTDRMVAKVFNNRK